MAKISVELPKELPKREPKEMLTVTKRNDGRSHVRINYSSYDLLNLCLRKADYALNRKLSHNRTSPALVFGSAIHKALEVWYCSSIESRTGNNRTCRDWQESAYNEIVLGKKANSLVGHGECARCGSVFAYLEAVKELDYLDVGDKRRPEMGLKILNNYFNTYLKDNFVVAKDDLGPITERTYSAILDENQYCVIEYFGTIDVVWKATGGTLFVCDHKTTSSVGNDFFNRIYPNFQYTGYVWLARKNGLDVKSYYVNGIQVAKTMQNLSRQAWTLSETDFVEFKDAVVSTVERWLTALDTNNFPQNTPNPCTQWGGCSYRELCLTTPELRESVIRATYEGETA